MIEQKANYTLTIEADSGYMSTTEGRCTADQYGQAIAALPGEAPQRTWVGLTIEDKEEYLALDFGGNRLDAMDWAARKLKEKNNG